MTLWGPQLLWKKTSHPNPKTGDPLLSIPFILVLDPHCLPSSPLLSPHFPFIFTVFPRPVSLSSLLTAISLSSALIRALVPPSVDRHPWSPKTAQAGVPRGSHTTQALVHRRLPVHQALSHQTNAQGGSRAPAHCPLLPTPLLTVRTQTTSVAAVGPWVPPRRASAAEREGRPGPGRWPGP